MIMKIQTLLLILFASNLCAANLPSFITVQNKDGILIRDSATGQKSNSVGAVHYLYSYPVVDGKVTYFKVQLPDNKQGWVYVGGEKK